MQLIEVDIVGLQATQRSVDGVEQMLARRALVPGSRPHPADGLGRQDIGRALALEPTADDFLGAADRRQAPAERVDVRGVEKIDPRRSRLAQDLDRHGFFGLQAERHRAEREAGNSEACAAKARGGHAHGDMTFGLAAARDLGGRRRAPRHQSFHIRGD
jgi:hypothetical protein